MPFAVNKRHQRAWIGRLANATQMLRKAVPLVSPVRRMAGALELDPDLRRPARYSHGRISPLLAPHPPSRCSRASVSSRP